MDFFHVTMASEGRLPLFADEATRRRAVRTLVQVCGAELVLFCLVDEHLHAVWACDRQRASRLAQALFAALRVVVRVPLQPARVRAVESRSHLDWLVRYVLNQVAHHDLREHSALWTGSCFQDLARARYIAGFELRVIRDLARFRIRQAFQVVGLPSDRIEPASRGQVFAAGLVRLVEAASAAAAVGPTLAGKSALVIQAKQAAVHIGSLAGFQTVNLAQALGLTRRAIQLLRGKPAQPELVRAIRVRLALEDLVAKTATAGAARQGPGGVRS